MANLILNGSTSGSVTLSSPAVSGTTTLTLPTTSGTVLTNGTNTNFPAGSVLQVISAIQNTGGSTSTSTRADTGLTASITPSSSSNKILVFVDMAGCAKTTNTAAYLGFWLMRGSTDLIQFEGQAGWTNTTTINSVGACSTNYLDSPSSTSSVTYKVQFNSPGNVGVAYFGASSSVSTITLMEIKG
jgi:hypothetical protein